MAREEMQQIHKAIKGLKKKLPRKWLWVKPKTEEEKEKFEKNSEILIRLDYIAFALYEVETAYEGLKRFNRKYLSEEAEALFECMKKLYLRLGEVLKSVQ